MANKVQEMLEIDLFPNQLDERVREKKMKKKIDQDRLLEKVGLGFKNLNLHECCELCYSLERSRWSQMEALLYERNLNFLEMKSDYKIVGRMSERIWKEAEENRRNELCNQKLQRKQIGECDLLQADQASLSCPEKFQDVEISFLNSEDLMKDIKIVEVLGEGGNGTAELVSHKGKLCVLKTALRGKIEALELQIMKYLEGAGGAPKVLAAAEDRFLCSLAGDQSLEDLMNNESLDQDFLMRAVRKVAERVREIHGKSITHNDLKANNIMYDSTTGDFNIIDFGLSSHIGETLYEIKNPEAYARINWQAPEVKNGQTITGKSDVYSLGIMLRYVVLLFKRPNETALSLAGRATLENPSDRPNLEEFIDILKWVEDANVFRKKFLGGTYRETAEVTPGSMDELCIVTYSLKNFEEEDKTDLKSQDWSDQSAEDADDWIEDWEEFSTDDWGKV